MFKGFFKRPLREQNAVKKIFWQTFVSYALYYATYTAGIFVDGVIVGNFLGAPALAAYSLVFPALMFFMFIYAVLTTGSRSIFTELLGKGELDGANSVFTLANVFCFALALAVAAGTFIFANPIMRLLGATGQNAGLEAGGADYIRGYAPGIVFYYCAKVLHGYMNIDSDYKRTVYAIVIMTLVNIAGDLYVVLYTDSGIFELALATSFSNFVYFVTLALHFRRKQRLLRFTFSRPRGGFPAGFKNPFPVFLEICRRGVASAEARIVPSIRGILINRIITASAVHDSVAAYGVQQQCLKLLEVICWGMAEAVLLMSGVYYGEEDKNALDELQVYSMETGIFLAAFFGVGAFAFSGSLARLYMGRSNPEALAMASEAIKCLALTAPLCALNYAFSSYLQGVKRFQAANLYMFLLTFGISVPCVYGMVRIFGARGAWLATPVAVFSSSVLCGLYIYFQDVPGNIKKRLLLDRKFFRDGAEVSLVADSMMEVVGMSRIAMLFCEENHFSGKIALRLALCVEEMCGNIIQYGFNDGKRHYLYLRLLAREDKVILRLRDDCKPFNPLERYSMTVPDESDPLKNIGIRMVMKLCPDVVYLSTFNTNNLIITIPKEQTDREAKHQFVNAVQESI